MVYRGLFSYRQRVRVITLFLNIFFVLFCVLSMRMQVILDSSFARPGSVPIWAGKKGEFRDSTSR